ncbi:hypothetical protein JCM11641_003606 [Rhodosporidiobolus odoratus]
MAKGKTQKFYAVYAGRKPGVYSSWPETQDQVNGFQGAKHKSFASRQDAEYFVRFGKEPSISAGRSQSSITSTTSSTASKGKGRALDQDEPPSKRRKVDPVFGKSSLPKGERVVYCDGSSRGNGQKGAVAGIGVFWSREPGAPNLSERLPGAGKLQTNNRAEMYAVARILESDPTPDLPLTICSDSEYTIGVFSKWIPGWKRRGWKTSDGKAVANQDLIRYVLSLLALRTPAGSTSPTANITFHKVKAHVGIEGNEQADRFANNGAMKPEAEDVDFAALTAENERKLRARKGTVTSVEDVQWGVEESDLLDAVQRLRRTEPVVLSQYFPFGKRAPLQVAPPSMPQGFYAVRAGRNPGVYGTQEEAEAQVEGFPGARHQRFATRGAAEAYVKGEEGVFASGSATVVKTPEGSPEVPLKELQ